MHGKKAVVLLSGGLDSTTTLAIAQSEGYETYALSFRYGQRHEQEIDAAQRIAQHFGVADHKIVDLNLRAIGGSALTDDIDVPKGRSLQDMSTEIPVTYVPGRNLIFLSIATAYAEKIGTTDIFIGVNALDYSGYPDCRSEFIESFEKTADLATKAGTADAQRFRIHAPLIRLTKAQIIQRGLALSVAYDMTITCYDPSPDGAACGLCDACLLRLKGFADNGTPDPARYQEQAAAIA